MPALARETTASGREQSDHGCYQLSLPPGTFQAETS